MVKIQNLEQKQCIRVHQLACRIIDVKLYIKLYITLIPQANGVPHFPEVTHCGGKGKDQIILACLILAIDCIIECDILLVIDYWLVLFVFLLDIAACVLIHDVYSEFMGVLPDERMNHIGIELQTGSLDYLEFEDLIIEDTIILLLQCRSFTFL